MAVAVAKAQELGYEVVACPSTGNLANAVAAHSAAAGLDSYVFIPADLEEQKVLATGRLRHQPGGRARHLRRRQPALHRAVGRARLGVRERQRAALLRGGLEDARVRDRRAARLRAARPHRGADRVRLAVHEDRARLRGVARGRARRGRAAGDSTARRPTGCSPVAQAFEAGRDVCRPGASRTRSPSRSRSGTRPTGRTRSTWRGARAARSTP